MDTFGFNWENFDFTATDNTVFNVDGSDIDITTTILDPDGIATGTSTNPSSPNDLVLLLQGVTSPTQETQLIINFSDPVLLNDFTVSDIDAVESRWRDLVSFSAALSGTDVPVTLTPANIDESILEIDGQTVQPLPGTQSVASTQDIGDVVVAPSSFIDSLTLSYSNIGGENSSIIYIDNFNFTPNQVPIASSDEAQTVSGVPVTINVVSNDTDEDGSIISSTVDLDPLTEGIQEAFSRTSEGSYTSDGNGNVTFIPELDFTGDSTITYNVMDDAGSTSEVANITVTVDGESNAASPIGSALAVSEVVANEDGSYGVIFTVQVTNLAPDPIREVQLTFTENFETIFEGATVALAQPPFSEVRLSENFPTGVRFSINRNFDGFANVDLLSGVDHLPGNASAEFNLMILVTPESVNSFNLQLQAAAVAGPLENPIVVTDLSDAGAVIDPNGNNNANEAEENNPTSLSLSSSFSVSGNVSEDANGDGEGDFGIAEVTLELFDATDGTTGVLIGTAITDTEGNYQFIGLPDGGEYVIVQQQPDGYDSVFETDGIVDNRIALMLNGSDSLGNDFVEEKTEYTDLSLSANIEQTTVNVGEVFTLTLFLSNDGSSDATGIEVTNTLTPITGVTFVSAEATQGIYDDALGTWLLDQLTENDSSAALNLTFQVNSPITVTSTAAITAIDQVDENIQNNRASVSLIVAETASIGGFVFEDIDNDGLGDSPLNGVTLELLDIENNVLNSTVTDTNGEYIFDNLVEGTYQISQTNLTSFSDVTDSDGGNPNLITVGLPTGTTSIGNNFIDKKEDEEIAGITIESAGITNLDGSLVDSGEVIPRNILYFNYTLTNTGNDTTRIRIPDFVTVEGGELQGSIELSYDGGTTWTTVNDVTDSLKANQSVLARAPITVARDAVTGLVSASVRLGDTPDNGQDQPFIEGIGDVFTLDLPDSEDEFAGEPSNGVREASATQSIELSTSLLGSIGGSVLEDTDNDDIGDTPIANVTIRLQDIEGNFVTSTLTNEDGAYIFSNLSDGVYQIVENNPDGYIDVTDSDGDEPNLITVELAPGEASTDNIFVDERSTSRAASISGSVLEDTDNDNIGDSPLEDVTLILLDTAGNSVTTTTDTNGFYAFDNLVEGTYQVIQAQPDGYDSISDSDGDNDNRIVVNLSDTDSLNNNFVERQSTSLLGSISGLVLEDTNKNGEGDTPLPGVNINLLDAAGNFVMTASDPNGFYIFDNLAEGTYQILQTNLDGYIDVADSDGDDPNLITVVLSAGATSTDNIFIDELGTTTEIAGITVVPSGISDLNGGSVNTGDSLYFNYTVTNAGNDTTQIRIPSFATVEGGTQQGVIQVSYDGGTIWEDINDFTNPLSSNESVLARAFVEVAETAVDASVSVRLGDTPDDGQNQLFTQGVGDVFTIDLPDSEDELPGEPSNGIREASATQSIEVSTPLLGSISGSVLEDTDNDGIGDSPIEGVTLTLLDANGTFISERVTDADGFYAFENLAEGTYQVLQSQPEGYDTVSDSEGDILDDRIFVSLRGADSLNNNFVERLSTSRLGFISGSVLEDTNKNGEGDTPIPGVIVNLSDINGSLITTTTTDANGEYIFENLAEGTYQISQTNLDGYIDVTDADGDDPNQITVVLPTGATSTDNIFVDELGATTEIAGITVIPNDITDLNGDSVNTGDSLYYFYTVTNTGNDTTQVRIPNSATANGPGIISGNLAVSYDGGNVWTPITGDIDSNALQADESFLVRIPVTVATTAVAGESISVEFGDTPSGNDQDVTRSADAGDVYTVDLPDGGEVNEVNGEPINGTREASATQSITITANPVDTDGDGITDTDDRDDDNDGILDVNEGDLDSDNDGFVNFQDPDSDGDGINDVIEVGGGSLDADLDGQIDGGVDFNGVPLAANGGLNLVDADGDGISNFLDLDSDSDGISDTDEGDQDTDSDGISNFLDLDSDNDGLLDANEGTADTDGDGINNSLDLDSDSDGIPDNVEAQETTDFIAPTGIDANGNGVDDVYDSNALIAPSDTDSDGTPDFLDLNSDSDNKLDQEESGLVLTGLDENGDGIDDGINADYSKPNGDINVPLEDLQNIDNVAADVDFRSVNIDFADLVATSFDVVNDHVLQGIATVNYTIRNNGTLDITNDFKVNIVYSNDDVIGNGDDEVVGSFSVGELGIGDELTDSITVQLPVATLNARAIEDDAPHHGQGYSSQNVDYLGLVIDPDGVVAESNEENNFNQGKAIDKDDITYFPWDIDSNGLVTPTDAIYVINRLGVTNASGNPDPLADLNGNGTVTPTDALQVINRLGYSINPNVLK